MSGLIAKGRPSSALVAVFLAALALAACGGSGRGDSSTAATQTPAGSKTETTGSNATLAPADSGSNSASSAGSAGSGSAVAANPGKTGSAATGKAASAAAAPAAKARRKARTARHRLEAKAGAAAPFLVDRGDNSIPTYGSEASSSQLSEATTSLRSYLQARAAGDWTTACSFMANAVRNQVEALAGGSGAESKGCADAYAKLSERVPASQRVSPLTGALAALRVEADKAFALFYGPHEQQYMVPMVSEGGVWKASQIEPIPWPIGSAVGSE